MARYNALGEDPGKVRVWDLNERIDRPDQTWKRPEVATPKTNINFGKLHRQSRQNRKMAITYREELLNSLGMNTEEYNADLREDESGELTAATRRRQTTFSFWERLWLLVFGSVEAGMDHCEVMHLNSEDVVHPNQNLFLWRLTSLFTFFSRYVLNGVLFLMLYPLNKRAAYERFDIWRQRERDLTPEMCHW